MAKMKIYYKSGYKHQLSRDYSEATPITGCNITTLYIELSPDGRLTLFAGYAWDGASSILPDLKCLMRPSLKHDGFYQLMREGLLDNKYRPVVDAIFASDCCVDGVWPWLASLFETCLRLFGCFASKAKNRRIEICAP